MHRIVSRDPRQTAKASTGATLIEVMIALVIMSIGLLGLASLQLSGISTSSNSEKRTQAAVVANDLIERMRANPAGVTAANYVSAFSATIDCTTPPANFCEDRSAGAANCTSTDMANFDAYSALCNAKPLLQNLLLQLTCSDDTGTTQACSPAVLFRTITVGWDDQTDNGTKSKTLTMTFQP